jgi:hypothetical protein
MTELAKDYAKDGTWLNKFMLVGGVPRLVFGVQTMETLWEYVLEAIPKELADLKILLERVQSYNVSAVGDNRYSHILFHFLSHGGPGKAKLKFASSRIRKQVETSFGIQSRKELESLMMTSDTSLQGWRGKRIEVLALEDLSSRTSIEASSLEDVGSHVFDTNVDYCSQIQAIEQANQSGLFVPISKTFPAIDALFINEKDATILYIQCTVSKNHPVKHGALNKIFNKMDERYPQFSHFFVFLVPMDIFYDFRKQSYLCENGEERKRQSSTTLRIRQCKSLLDFNSTSFYSDEEQEQEETT